MHSTFSALSSSLALNPLKYPHNSGLAQTHLLILLGPSLFRPRHRVLFTIDGLKVQAQNSGTGEEILTGCEDENRYSGRNTAGKPNRVDKLDQARSPLSSISPLTTDVLNGSDHISPERTENHTSLDSVKPADSSYPPPDESFAGYPGEQQALSAAERLLSRSLTMACAEDGVTLNAELGPSYSSAVGPKY